MKTIRPWGKARYTVHQRDGTTKQITIQARDRWALEALIAAGEIGCTPLDHPGPRRSAYAFDLRHEHGLEVETITEPHGGDFAGNHARYVLHSQIAFAGEALE